VHEVGTAASERDVRSRIDGMRFRASSSLLSLEAMEKKLANAQEFKEAAQIAARCHKQRQLEELEYERSKALIGTKPRAAHRAAQAAELKNLLQKNHSLRVAVRRERDQAHAVFQQKYRNLEADLDHACKIEWHLRPEIGAVQAQKSRSTHASTFRGTLKYESLAGTKFDVPDVSKLDDIPPQGMKRAETKFYDNASSAS
jgi:hypothetical protein